MSGKNEGKGLERARRANLESRKLSKGKFDPLHSCGGHIMSFMGERI